MANDKISAMTAAVAADIVGNTTRLEIASKYTTTPATLGLDLATLRTVMFAGSTGYTATDPLVCGAISTSGDFAVASTKFTVAAASGNTAVAGTLAVTGASTLTGVVGIGGAVNAAVGLYVRNTALTGTTQTGLTVAPVVTSGSTSAAYGSQTYVSTAAAAFTVTAGYAVAASSPSLGAGSAITTQYGFYAFNQGATGVTNAYGMYIAAQSGAATTNIGLYNAGTTQLVGAIGIGTAPLSHQSIRVAATTTGNASQFGIVSVPTVDSGATTAGYGIYTGPTTANASFTCTNLYGAFVANITKGAASTVTNHYGVFIEAPTQGGTLNIGLYNAGTSHLIGNLGVGEASTATSLLHLKKSSIPTSAAGLAAGDVWSNSGVLTIV